MGGISGAISDLTNKIGNRIDNAWNTVSSSVSGLVNDVGTWATNLWDGGFAGVSDFDALKTAVTNYVADTQAIIDEFNTDANLDGTVKGEANQALHDYIVATKTALNSYVSVLNIWKDDLDAVYEAYKAGDQTVSSNVNDATDVLNDAVKNIDSDSTGIGGYSGNGGNIGGGSGSGPDIG